MMRAKEIFDELRRKKPNWFNLLKVKTTFTVGAIVLGSTLIAYALAVLIDWLLPESVHIPFVLNLAVISLTLSMVTTRILSRIFFKPVNNLRKAFERVADGDFTTRIETTSSTREFQELFAGFNMMTQELSATEILQTDFVSNVSHEFKTPISAIEGYSTLLQGCEQLDEENREYVEKILYNTKRLSGLVSNILLLSKIENQSIQTDRSRYALDEQIRESILSLEGAWDPKKIEFDLDLEEITYFGSESMMYHVWTNIISNAVKFSPVGSTVTVRLFKEGDKIVFIAKDMGPGLSEEAKKHIFDKFYQADSSHKQDGNGLGLALIKRILAVAGGDIKGENAEDQGCIFTVILDAN